MPTKALSGIDLAWELVWEFAWENTIVLLVMNLLLDGTAAAVMGGFDSHMAVGSETEHEVVCRPIAAGQEGEGCKKSRDQELADQNVFEIGSIH